MLIHLLELRRRAIYSLSFFGVLFIAFFFIANDLFHILISPLLSILPNQKGLIATQITSPVVTPLKLAADAALLLSAPFALYQLWGFIRPGLHKKEQQQFRGIIVLSLLLFFSGLMFCYYLILPFMFQFSLYVD